MKAQAAALTIVIAAAFGVAGCADDPGRGAGAEKSGQETAQAWALGDGNVTEEEYRTAVAKFIGCMADAGYGATEPMLSPVDGLTLLFDFKPSGDIAAYNAKLELCNETQFTQIEPKYVEARTQVMDPALRKAATECLTKEGFEVTGTETNVREFMAATGTTVQVTMDCVSPAMKKLFPGLPALLKVRV